MKGWDCKGAHGRVTFNRRVPKLRVRNSAEGEGSINRGISLKGKCQGGRRAERAGNGASEQGKSIKKDQIIVGQGR